MKMRNSINSTFHTTKRTRARSEVADQYLVVELLLPRWDQMTGVHEMRQKRGAKGNAMEREYANAIVGTRL